MANCTSHRNSVEKQNFKVLKLDEIDTLGSVIPQGWEVSMKYGIQKILKNNNSDELVMVCSCPIIISRRFENIDDGTQKVEIKFLNHNH